MLYKQSSKSFKCSKTFGRDCTYLDSYVLNHLGWRTNEEVKTKNEQLVSHLNISLYVSNKVVHIAFSYTSLNVHKQ